MTMVVKYAERNGKPTSFSSSESSFRSRGPSMSSMRSGIKSKFHEWKLLVLASCTVGVGVLILTLVFVVKKNNHEVHPTACVVTNGYECADIGTSILAKGGNAIEVAIATLFCEGVAMPQSMGLGGGFIMTFYNRTTKKAWTLNARETAPSAANKDMFNGNQNNVLRGGKSVAIPGDLRGYWHLYQNFGHNLAWKELVQPTIDLCRRGIYVTKFLNGMLNNQKELLRADPVLRDIFFDPSTNDTYKEGQRVKRLRLAKTLEIISKEGGEALNNGTLTPALVRDIQKAGGIITEEDMMDYSVVREDSLVVPLSEDQLIYSPPLPGGGLVLSFILRLLDNFIDKSDPRRVVTNQRIVESFKWAYGRRTHFGDPKFRDMTQFVDQVKSDHFIGLIRKTIKDDSTSQNPEDYGAYDTVKSDHGTAHISILDKEGNAVSVTGTINQVFGAGFASDSTGIILNDEMDDFSGPSTANNVMPGKRPLSSMTPSVIVDRDGDVAMVVGGAGGIKITTAVALTIIRYLWYRMDVKSAVYEKRFHHQLIPMNIEFDEEYKTEAWEIIQGLHKIGHKYKLGKNLGFGAVTAIIRKKILNEEIIVEGSFDKRRSGSVSYTPHDY